ncbi:MAG: hypothetical protein K8J31_31010 [Anaerolineae bacterium]|nr:hypothetical protein [Anaerolineae bacterium]
MREELRDRFGTLPQAVDNLLYQIDVKLLAQTAGATAVASQDDRVQVRLPYLPDINRDDLQRKLGPSVTVTRTAVELSLADRESWQIQLLDVLTKLARAAETAANTLGI